MGISCSRRAIATEETIITTKSDTNARPQISQTSSREFAVQLKAEMTVRSESNMLDSKNMKNRNEYPETREQNMDETRAAQESASYEKPMTDLTAPITSIAPEAEVSVTLPESSIASEMAPLQTPAAIASLCEPYRKLLMGHIKHLPTCIPPKVIHLFLHSLRSDCRRTVFISQLSVKLRMYCAAKGFELNIVDLSSGEVGDFVCPEYHNDELRLYLKESTNVGAKQLHMIFLGDDLGEINVPSRIGSSDFLHLLDVLENEQEKQVFTDWFSFIDSEQQVYILKPTRKEVVTHSQHNHGEVWRSWLKSRSAMVDIITSKLPGDFQEKYCTPCLQTSVDAFLSTTEGSGSTKKSKVVLVDVPADNSEESASRPNSGLIESGDENSHVVLLRKRIRANMDAKNILEIKPEQLKDAEGSIKSSSEFVKNFCDNLNIILSAQLDELMDETLTEVASLPVLANSSNLYNEICHVFEYCKTICGSSLLQERPEIIGRLQSYVDSSDNHVLVIAGPAGSGKTTLVANFALEKALHSTSHCCIIRFVGQPNACGLLSQVVKSFSKQISILQGSNSPKQYARQVQIQQPVAGKSVHGYIMTFPTFARQNAVSAESLLISVKAHLSKAFHGKYMGDNFDVLGLVDLLSTTPQSCPLLVIVDGIDQCADNYTSVEWIPAELPTHVKFIVTTRDDGEVYEHLKIRLPNLECYLDIPPLDAESVVSLLETFTSVKTHQLPPAELQYVKDNIHRCTLPMQIRLISELMQFLGSDEIDGHLGANLEDIVESYLSYVEHTLPDPIVSRILAYLAASRFGLTDSELMDLLSCDEEVLDNLNEMRSPKVRIFPTHIWIRLQKVLKPVLLCCHNEGKLMNRLIPGVIADIVVLKYYERQAGAVHSVLADYFTGRWANGKLKPYIDKNGVIDTFADRYVLPQPHHISGLANIRKLQELPFHKFNSVSKKRYSRDFLFNAEWLQTKLASLGTDYVLQDIFIYKSNTPRGAKLLAEAIQLSCSALEIDPTQLAAQLHLRLRAELKMGDSALNLLSKLINDLLQSDSSFLLSDEPCLDEVSDSGITTQNNEDSFEAITRLTLVPSNPNLIISLSQKSGTVSTWDIETLEMEAKIKELKCPRDIRMFDAARAAILCDREINIYNLMTGEFESKLKGVLNANMPFYGIHDDKHVVSLSRNRMYVNITNTDSGDMVSTFKVGESRFLDSLLVSGNGVMLVCGDETQKPFPLLVWNLPDRKLVHDLRIPKHEFVTAISDISYDGHYVACVAKELDSSSPNFIVVYDLITGQIFKKWKPDFSTTCLTISSKDQSVVIGLDNGILGVWALADGALRHEIAGRGGPALSVSLSDSGKQAATVNHMSSRQTVCLYDLNYGSLLGTFTPDSSITCCQISAGGDVVLIGLGNSCRLAALRPNSVGNRPRQSALNEHSEGKEGHQGDGDSASH